MANYKPSASLLEQLSDEDRRVLEGIYEYRCLNAELAARYFYHATESDSSKAETRLEAMTHNLILERVDTKKDRVYFLTTLGIEVIKALGLYPGSVRSASSVRIRRPNIRHQLRLNDFALRLAERLRERNGWRYYDSLYMPACCEGMFPDAVVEFPDRIALLEMDLGNERKKSLEYKWNNYRYFLENRTPFYRDKKIAMYFILDGPEHGINRRKNNVMEAISRRLLDQIDGEFETYVDSPEALLDILTSQSSKETQKKEERGRAVEALYALHEFTASPAIVGSTSFLVDAYLRRMTVLRRVDVQHGRPQEFLMDVWDDGRLSVLHRIVYHAEDSLLFRKEMKRDVAYLVVVPSEQWLYGTLSHTGALGQSGVYYTTARRLEERPTAKALFQIDELGSVYHFTDMGLKERVFENKLRL